VTLPIAPPFPPMEALLAAEIPSGDDWQYEPKWDGFRCLVFRDGDEIQLQSKAGQPLGRYFPELLLALSTAGPRRFVLDSEIVVPVAGWLSFDELLQRIHPAESRVRKLAGEHPAVAAVFDLLVDGRGTDLTRRPLAERRASLEQLFQSGFGARQRTVLSPATRSIEAAREWLSHGGGNLDGVIAKRLDLGYQSGERGHGMLKVKRLRSADCVVGGFRYASSGKTVGSLLLGLYDGEGLLHHVGFTSGLSAREKKPLTAKLEKLVEAPGFTGRAPGGPSRWSTERSGDWQPLRPELVVEVQYDHFTGGRFRHGTRLLRWRPDKPAHQCLMDQVQQESAVPPVALP
jgi:ATP-dependent DNA ligase